MKNKSKKEMEKIFFSYLDSLIKGIEKLCPNAGNTANAWQRTQNFKWKMTLTDWFIAEGIDSLGDMFRWLRLEHNLSLRDVSKDTKIPISVISNFENNKYEPKFWTVIRLANYYEYSWNDLNKIVTHIFNVQYNNLLNPTLLPSAVNKHEQP